MLSSIIGFLILIILIIIIVRLLRHEKLVTGGKAILRNIAATFGGCPDNKIAYEGTIKTGGGCEVDENGNKIVTGNGNDEAKIKSYYAATYKSGTVVHLNYTTWCPCCTGFMQTWDKFAAKAPKNIVAAKHDLGKMSVPGINKVPTVVVYNAENSKLRVITGPKSADEINAAIREVQQETA